MLTTDRDQVLLERLNRHPQMRARVESLLAVVSVQDKIFNKLNLKLNS